MKRLFLLKVTAVDLKIFLQKRSYLSKQLVLVGVCANSLHVFQMTGFSNEEIAKSIEISTL